MQLAFKNTISYGKLATFLTVLLFATIPLYSQNTDSLLEKIRDLDISLNEPVDSEEDLYMNTVSFQSFYDVLSPMGEWIQITKEDVDDDLSDGEGEGKTLTSYFDNEKFLFIWKPKVESGWKPYSNGKWEYTDHGWFWVSNDKWGNSTYNYGRWWDSPKYGWVWLPGYIWAPAWVRWKVTNDDKYVGWVALSPKAKWKSENGITGNNYNYNNKDADWVFVENNTFSGEITTNNIAKQNDNSGFVKNSTTITDIKTEDDKIVTNGPDVNRMEEKTGKKFERKKIKFSKGNYNTVIRDKDVTVNREKFNRHDNGQKEKIGKPNKFKKSERVKKIIRKKHSQKTPPNRNR